jgi:hypothetical protein
MGVPLSDNLDGTAFTAANICDTCDVLLTSSRARSDTLCTKDRAKRGSVRSAEHHTSKVRSGHHQTTPTMAQPYPTTPSMAQTTTFSNYTCNNTNTTYVESGAEFQTLKEQVSTVMSTMDELVAAVAQLEVQNDWSQVSTGYMTCGLGMTWSEILDVLGQQRSSNTKKPDIVTGGLGRKMIVGKYEVWVCRRQDR